MADIPDDMRAQLEIWLSLLEMLGQMHQDETIAHAESELAEASAPWPFPMPETAHPSLERHAAFVRNLDNANVLLPTRAPRASLMTEDAFPTSAMPEPVRLDRRRVWAPAPAVLRHPGDRAAYMWSAWLDNMGRHITGPAELVWASNA